jgi:pimeloyl-ACP methyl ester carboxylesterase
MRARWATVAFLLVAATACRGGGDEASSTPPAVASPSPRPSAEPASSFPVLGEDELLAMSEPVTFEAKDGVGLEGRLFGAGDVGVVLSHMQPGDQGQWLAFAGLLADRGYRVLTFDRRGVCPGGDLGCSEGDDGDPGAWRDLASAVALLRDEGSDRVVVGGASLGAMESLYALSHGLDADGLIWLSGLDLYEGESIRDQVRDVHVPTLFMGGAFDPNSAVIGPAIARAAPEPIEIVPLETGEHGTDILRFGDPVVADRIRQTVLDFLAGI